MAKELERAGANIIAIKDMAGLLKPQAAYELISAMKDAVTVPIHLHSHEGSGNTIYTYARAIDAGVDIVDVAMSAMSNGTSQPSAASLYYALDGHPRQPKLSVDALNEFSRYWETIRPYYKAADKTENFPNPETYVHEMPGGQYTNLKQQAAALGLLDRWEDIKDMYHVRRSDQGYAFFQSRRRHDPVHGAERNYGRRCVCKRGYHGLPEIRHRVL